MTKKPKEENHFFPSSSLTSLILKGKLENIITDKLPGKLRQQ